MDCKASVEDVVKRITKKIRNPDLADEMIEKVETFNKTHNPDDDLSRRDVGMLYGDEEFGDEFDVKNGELEIGWSDHAEYRSQLRDIDSGRVNEGIRNFVENSKKKEHKKINLIKPFGKAVVDVDTQREPETADVITVMSSEKERVMNRMMVASELVKIAKEIKAMGPEIVADDREVTALADKMLSKLPNDVTRRKLSMYGIELRGTNTVKDLFIAVAKAYLGQAADLPK